MFEEDTYSTPSPPLKWWQNWLGNALMVLIYLAFAIVMWPVVFVVTVWRWVRK
jgi:hypothetical protein